MALKKEGFWVNLARLLKCLLGHHRYKVTWDVDRGNGATWVWLCRWCGHEWKGLKKHPQPPQ